jgi:hypothetical protein
MVNTFDDQEPVTPAGNPVTVAPVAPVVEYVKLVSTVLIQSVWLVVPDVKAIVLFGLTMIVSTRLVNAPPPEQPFKLIAKIKGPEIKGEPFNTIAPELRLAIKPLGNPQPIVSIEVAFVGYEIVGIVAPIQTVGLDKGLITLHCPKTFVEPTRKTNKKTKKIERIN